MKKTVTVVVVLVTVVCAAWIGSSWYFGRKVESQFRQLVAKAANMSGARITIESYRRGLLSATARTRIALPAPMVKSGPSFPLLVFTVISKIEPGPFPGGPAGWQPAAALIRTRLALGPKLLQKIQREWPAVPKELPLTSTTLIYFGGNGETWTNGPPFHQTVGHAQPVAVDWQGLSGHATFSAGFKEYRGHMKMPALEVSGKTGRFRLAGVTANFDLHLPQGLGGLMLGDWNYRLHRLEFAAGGTHASDGKQLALQNLVLQSSSWEADGLISGALRASFQKLSVDGSVNGPGVYDMQVTNVDAAACQKLQRACRRLQHDPGLTPQKLQAQLGASFGRLWPRIAARSPGIAIRDLSLKSPNGDLHCRARLSINGNDKKALTNLMLLPRALSAQASVNVSAPMLRKAMGAMIRQQILRTRAASGRPPLPAARLNAMIAADSQQRITTLVKKHILVAAGGSYKLTAAYQSGHATLNGRPMPLP